MVAIRVPTFFGNLTYGDKIMVLLNFSPISPSVRVVVPPRSNCSDGNFISLREGVTQTHSRPAFLTRCHLRASLQCAYKHIVYNADTVSTRKKL